MLDSSSRGNSVRESQVPKISTLTGLDGPLLRLTMAEGVENRLADCKDNKRNLLQFAMVLDKRKVELKGISR